MGTRVGSGNSEGPMIKRICVYSAVLLAFAAAFTVTRRVRSQEDAHKPFTVFQIERRYDDTGVEAYNENKLTAIRSDGSWAWTAQRPGPDGHLYGVGAIYDLSKRQVIGWEGLTESISTTRLTDGELAFYKKVDRSCQASSERSTALGQEVAKYAWGREKSEMVEWRAPEMNCFPLRTIAKKLSSSLSVEAKTTTETLFILPGEPAPSLFSPPPGYTERSPSSEADEYERRFGKRPFSSKIQQKADEKYLAKHQ
jgi:hypothetical protein